MSAPIQTSDESQVLLHQLKGSFTSIYLTEGGFSPPQTAGF